MKGANVRVRCGAMKGRTATMTECVAMARYRRIIIIVDSSSSSSHSTSSSVTKSSPPGRRQPVTFRAPTTDHRPLFTATSEHIHFLLFIFFSVFTLF